MVQRLGLQAVRLTVVSALLLPLLPLGPASAALPPYWQRQRELEAILQSMDVADKLREQPIVSIRLVEPDVYQVETEACYLMVNIVDKPPGPGEQQMVGPRLFELEIGEPECE